MIIDRFLHEHEIALRHWLDSTTLPYHFPLETEDGYCIFFDNARRTCRIHPVKPETCRAGPITFNVDLARERIEWFVKPGSECLVADALLHDSVALHHHMQTAKTELMHLIRELEPRALRALLTIDEPTVLKVGEDPLPCLD